jgi:hypothetical protein
VVGLAIVLGLSPGAAAIPFNEIGDAGDLPALSQAAGVLPVLTSIRGSIGSVTDADMFAITISQAGKFSATTVGTPGTLVDSQLFLFRFTGLGVVANDDTQQPPSSRSTISGTALTPDLYFLGISSFDVDPSALMARFSRTPPSLASTVPLDPAVQVRSLFGLAPAIRARMTSHSTLSRFLNPGRSCFSGPP